MTQLETPVRKRAKCTALPTPFSTPSSSRKASEYFPEESNTFTNISTTPSPVAPEIESSAEIDEPEITAETEVEPLWKKNAPFLSRYLLRRGDRRQGTHSSLVGGRYFVPLEKRSTFYETYFKEFVRWLNASPTLEPSLFLTERYNGEYFRFFVDIDYEWSETPLSFLELIEYITKGVNNILTYLDDASYDQAPLEVRPSERTDHKRHVVFPQVIVDHTKALLFAQAVQKYVNNVGYLDTEHDVEFDTKVYQKGSLRMLGSCKKTGLVPGDVKETEFFYMPVDMATGERKKTITYEEFARHTILLDKETTERVEKFAALEDGSVCLPPDEQYSSALYVIPKYIHKEVSSAAERRARVYEESTYTGPREVSNDSPLHKCILELFGAEVANSTGLITHCPKWNSLKIAIDKSTFCPLAGREHTSNHAYITLSKRGIQMRCYSTNEPACRNGGEWTPLKDLPKEVVEMIPMEPEIVEDVCGGGESDEDDFNGTVVNDDTTEVVGDTPETIKTILRQRYDPRSEFDDQPNMVGYLNKHLALDVSTEGSVIYLWRLSVEGPWVSYSGANIKELLTDLTFSIKLEKTTLTVDPFFVWKRNSSRRKIDTTVLDSTYTGDCPTRPNIRNVWRGFKADILEEVDMEKIEVVRQHVFEVLCDSDDDKMTAFEAWQAHIVQRPEVKTGTAPVIFGEEGTGKSTIGDWLMLSVIGLGHSVEYDKMERITGKFNAQAENKIFAVVNEVSNFGGCIQTNDRLKNSVTNPMIAIEKKGMDVRHIPDYQNFIFFTNNSWPIRVTRRSRRFAVFRTSSKYIGNSEYFTRLHTTLAKKETADNYLTYLKNYQFTCTCGHSSHPERGNPVNVHRAIDTKEKLVMAGYLQTCADFFFESLMCGDHELLAKGEEATITNDMLFKAYMDVYELQQKHTKEPVLSLQKFGNKFAELVGNAGNAPDGEPFARRAKNIGHKKARGWFIRALMNPTEDPDEGEFYDAT